MCAKGEGKKDVDDGVRDVKPRFTEPEQGVVGGEGDHAPAMGEVMVREGFDDVAEGFDVPRRPPDEHVVVVVPVKGHEEIEEEHEGEEGCDDGE